MEVGIGSLQRAKRHKGSEPVAYADGAKDRTLALTDGTRKAIMQLRPVGAPLTIQEKHWIVLDGFAATRTVEKVHEFAARAKNQDFTPGQDDEQSDAFHSAMERIARTPARRPVPARA
jgi:hypothetical protein